MRVQIHIDCDNDAFDPAGTEGARILRDFSEKIRESALENDFDRNYNLRDVNGNKVGSFKVIGRRP